MVWLLHKDHYTNHCQFSIDSESDLELLPKYKVSGKGVLSTIWSCCPNSRAICTNGSVYVLNGDTNEWVKLPSPCGGSGGGSGGGSTELPDWNFATDEDIHDMFKKLLLSM